MLLVEVANDEEDNDKDDDDKETYNSASTDRSKAMNAFGGGEKTEGETGGSGASPELLVRHLNKTYCPHKWVILPQEREHHTQELLIYGIGLGDGAKGSRAMQPIKKRKDFAKKLFGMTPMGMAFNAGAKAFKGMRISK